jgi:hypothetical protein
MTDGFVPRYKYPEMCRYIAAHRHVILPAGSSYTVVLAEQQKLPGEEVLRIRWLPRDQVWQVCYVKTPVAGPEPGDEAMEREYPEWYDEGEVGA